MAPVEDELVRAVLESDLLHADETPWPEARQTLWLWVFVATTATLYSVAGRGKERVENVLDGFTGGLMSDGWGSYRPYARRRRCWVHLIRKARGLAQSGHPVSRSSRISRTSSPHASSGPGRSSLGAAVDKWRIRSAGLGKY